MGIEDVVTLANEMLVHVTSKDDRVMIDSGEVATGCSERAIANSLGLRCSEKSAIAGGSLFGMAVDGRDVGSFDYDGQNVTLRESLRQELLAAADRFMIKTIGALRACAGETFRGPIILTPEVVAEFIVGNLTSVMSAKSVRLSKSPFKGRLSERVVSPLISLWDEPRLPGGVASQSFDREGTPTKRIALLEEGVLRSFLFDVYESRSQKVAPTGHARGGRRWRAIYWPIQSRDGRWRSEFFSTLH
jgi:PmbA protein